MSKRKKLHINKPRWEGMLAHKGVSYIYKPVVDGLSHWIVGSDMDKVLAECQARWPGHVIDKSKIQVTI